MFYIIIGKNIANQKQKYCFTFSYFRRLAFGPFWRWQQTKNKQCIIINTIIKTVNTKLQNQINPWQQIKKEPRQGPGKHKARHDKTKGTSAGAGAAHGRQPCGGCLHLKIWFTLSTFKLPFLTNYVNKCTKRGTITKIVNNNTKK